MLTPDTLIAIAESGGGLDLRGHLIDPAVLLKIAEAAAASGQSPSIIISSKKMIPQNLLKIAAAGQGCVTIIVD